MANYHAIWTLFNKFIIKLDTIPKTWEERLVLYVGFCVDCGLQSSTVKSYISAIKKILELDGHAWNNDTALLNTLTKACRLQNDRVKRRLPIQRNLFELLLFQLEIKFKCQPYLEILYKAIFTFAYFGMLRIGELVAGDHTVKAKDVYVNKQLKRILIVLHCSKTHGLGDNPQKVSVAERRLPSRICPKQHTFCPFDIINAYMAFRGGYDFDDEHFFIFTSKQSIKPAQVRKVLRSCLQALGLNSKLYDTHSFRIGRATDLLFKCRTPLEKIKVFGRWRSNAVYKYFKP